VYPPIDPCKTIKTPVRSPSTRRLSPDQNVHQFSDQLLHPSPASFNVVTGSYCRRLFVFFYVCFVGAVNLLSVACGISILDVDILIII
jgi:hypothetical protein